MTTQAFTDDNDGYYEVDIPNGAPIPDWAASMSPCEVRQPTPESPEQIIARLTRAVEQYMDAVASAKGYDDRKTCTLRAGYLGPWQAEGQAFGAWMDNCWTYCYQVQANVAAGVRTIPAEAELIAELPVMIWP